MSLLKKNLEKLLLIVHKKLGPRLLELVYEVGLSHDLQNPKPHIERLISMAMIFEY